MVLHILPYSKGEVKRGERREEKIKTGEGRRRGRRKRYSKGPGASASLYSRAVLQRNFCFIHLLYAALAQIITKQ